MERIVEIARFTYPAEAHTLISLLKSEGIECFLRNEISSQVMAGYANIGGAKVDILESDVPRALEVMKEGGYEIPDEDEEAETINIVGGWASKIPGLRNFPLEKQIIILCAIIAALLGLLIHFGSMASSN